MKKKNVEENPYPLSSISNPEDENQTRIITILPWSSRHPMTVTKAIEVEFPKPTFVNILLLG